MAVGKNRTPSGGIIDRSKTVRFQFDGQSFDAHPGDTLASALLAHDVALMGRSFKYHRPRGAMTAGSEEPNALVELRTGARREANTKATTTEVFDGLEASSQNRWPSLKYDAMSVNSLLAPVFVAGFYYKTFMWPKAFWEKLYEPAIRRAAGLGRAAETHDPDSYEKVSAFCDVLVIGGGPAGLSAALQASADGARVILADENYALGGRAIDDARNIDGKPAITWVADIEKQLTAKPDVTVLKRTTIFGAYDGQTYGAVERVSDHLASAPTGVPRQRLWRIVAKSIVLAAGAIERPIVFGGNDRPGIMLAGAVRTYINRYGVRPGQRAIVFTNNDDGATTVNTLKAAGADVVALVDSRKAPSPHVKALAERVGALYVPGGTIVETRGRLRVSSAVIRDALGRVEQHGCDLIAMSGGWNPTIQMTTHLGGKPKWNDALASFVAGAALPPGMSVVGAANGEMSLNAALAGCGKAEETGNDSAAIEPLWKVKDYRGKAFVDMQNDVATTDIELAEREGFRAVEHLKRYTTLGMATDQGKTANVNALAIMAELTKRSIPETGITVARPPFTPVALGAFAGHHRGKDFRPSRLPPSYAWAKENGGQFVETGLWLRPSYFPRAGERDWLETVCREVTTTRTAVGVCDVSTLGKIDVQGKDAAAFIDKVYMNAMASLVVGRARYGVMLREDGIVMDDGTVARFGENHYFISTTTANAVKVMQHLEFCSQWVWPQFDVQISSATEQWAQYAVAGPKSRALLSQIVDPSFDISDSGFPYMHVGEMTVCGGTKARLFRLSFSGERAYEIGVPARYGDALWRRLMEAGRDLGVCAYGSEALGVMRIEKGHVSGPELNGTTTAHDIGLGAMMAKKKDFVGRTLAQREGLTDPMRPTLVGLRPINTQDRLRAGAHLVPKGVEANAAHDDGYVTSVAFSPSLNHWIGLGLLKNGPQRIGEVVRAYDPVRNGDVDVEVVSPVFIDREGEKVRG